MLHTFLALLIASAAVTGPREDLVALRAEVEQPLVVNGELVDGRTLKRFLVYSVGAPLIEAATLEAYIELYDPGSGQASEQLNEADVAAVRAHFKHAHRDLPFEVAIRREYGSRAIAERAFRAQVRFDAVFLPPNAHDWPQVTLDALASEEDVIEGALRKSEERLASGVLVRPELGVYHECLREIVSFHLLTQTPSETASEGLPVNVALRVVGDSKHIDLNLEDAFTLILPGLDSELIDRERHWIVGLEAVRQRLEAEGLLLGAAEAEQKRQEALADATRSYSAPDLGIPSHYHPSDEHHRAYFRLLISADQAFHNDDELLRQGELPQRSLPYLEQADQRLGLARVKARLMHFDARERATGQFTTSSWIAVHELASTVSFELATAVDELPANSRSRDETRCWNDVVNDLVDRNIPPSKLYPDPRPREFDPSRSYCGGGFRSLIFHHVRTQLESDRFDELRQPASSAAWVFFEQELGSVSKPLKTPNGYAIVWLLERIEPTHPLRMDEPKHRKLLRQYASQRAFTALWREAVRDATSR